MQRRVRSKVGSGSNGAGKTKRTKTSAESLPAISQPNHCNSEKLECNKQLSDAVKERSTLAGPLPLYDLDLQEEAMSVAGCRRFSFGDESNKPNRTIMVFGATSDGKSTLINGMINYILGVEWETSYRYKLVDENQSESRAAVTMYKLNHQENFKINFSLTVVDAPGFGETGGAERDEIIKELRGLFSAERGGVREVDAVCVVAQAAVACLAPSQKHAFDSVLSIFDKDVAENICVLVTVADGRQPSVLEAISASGVPCPRTNAGLPIHLKFNTSALFADNKACAADGMSGEDGGFDQMFWNMGMESIKRFFAALDVMETKSLTMTKEVLRERRELESVVGNLQKQVKVGLAKFEEIKETCETLKVLEAEISRSQNFESESFFFRTLEVNISGPGLYMNHCKQCNYTCHCPCRSSSTPECRAMGSDGLCTVCRCKCYWDQHVRQSYKWESEEVKEQRTAKGRKKKYLAATGDKRRVHASLHSQTQEYNCVQEEVEALRERSAQCLNRLEEIALQPSPLCTPDDFNRIIEGEKSEAKCGWKQRVLHLMGARDKAEIMTKVGRGETLLPSLETVFQCVPTP